MTPRSKYWDIRAGDVPTDLFPSGRVRISLGDHREKYAGPRRRQLKKLRREEEWKIIRAIADGKLDVVEVARVMKAEAEDAAIAELRSRVRAAEGDEVPTFGDQVDRHLEYLEEEGEHMPATIEQRRHLLGNLREAEVDGGRLGDLPVNELTASRLRRAIKAQTTSAHSRQSYRAAVSAMYSHAIREDREVARLENRPRRVTVNPGRQTDPFETRPRKETASTPQVRRLLKHSKLYQVAYIRPLVQLGLRQGELRHTRLHTDLDVETWEWRIQPRGPDPRCSCRSCEEGGWSPKTKNSHRTLKVPEDPPSLRRSITQYLAVYDREEGDLVFRSSTGRVWTRKSIARDFERLCERANVRYGRNTDGGITLHTLRHTAATNLIRSGVDSAVVAAILGDNVETVVSNYIHLEPDDLADGIARGPDFGDESAEPDENTTKSPTVEDGDDNDT